MQAKQKLLTSALLVAAVLLSATPSTAAATESMGDGVFVGESFTRQCGINTAVYWWLNGRLTNVTGNLYRVQNATVDHNGTLKCTATDQEKSQVFLSFEIRIHSLLGVSPSPSNCSSVDISTNTCTVTAAEGSSLTLCVDFTHYPSDTHHLNPYLTNTAWKREDNDWLWVCGRDNTAGNFSCDNIAMAFPSSVHGDWGRCLELNKVTQNSTFRYEIAVTPSKDYPAAYMNKVKKMGSFRVQVATPTSTRALPHVIPTSTRALPRIVPTSTVASSHATSAIIYSDIILTTPIALPHPPESTALTAAVPVTLGVIIIAVVGTVSATMMYCFKSGRLKTLHRRTHDEMCIHPKIQLLQMSESGFDGETRRTPPKTLLIAKQSTSTTKLLKSLDTPHTMDGSLYSATPSPPNVLPPSPPPPPPPPPSPPNGPPPPLYCAMHPHCYCGEYDNRSIMSWDFCGGLGPGKTV